MSEQPGVTLMDVSFEEIRHLVSDRAVEGDTVLLNMGPQHPSTHGVLRLLLELDGETVVNCIPDIGYLHTGIEKNMEAKTYLKAAVMTDRLDYLNTVGNNLVYCLAVEKLADLDVPPRAQAIRVILDRAAADRLPPGLVGNTRPGPGGHVRVSVLLPRAGKDPGYPGDDRWAAHDGYLYPPGRGLAGYSGGI